MTSFVPAVREASAGEFSIDRREALRYLGCGNAASNRPLPPEMLDLLDACEAELRAALRPRVCWARVPLRFPAPFTTDAGFGPVESVSLAKHLHGCHSALLFAATIGVEADRLIQRWSRLRPSRGAVLDALASAAVESWCDAAEAELTRDLGPHCDRFSPGYGDFALQHQRDIVLCLDTPRTLGLTLTGSLLMMPSKSVTAIIGLGASARTCGHRCMFCTKENCIYREVITP
jgi:hypothetical protein